MLNSILTSFNLNDSEVLGCFPYGSQVYGTATEKSDHDFVLVLKNPKQDSDQLDSENISITTYSLEGFVDRVRDNKLYALECFFCPEEKVLRQTKSVKFNLNKSKLRENVSEKVNKDYNQAKKRFSDSQGWNPVTNQPYTQKVYEGKKSLWHCFRLLDFAEQIVYYNRIVDFSSCNDLWFEIRDNPSETWQDYHDRYHQSYLNKMSEFRKLCPK